MTAADVAHGVAVWRALHGAGSGSMAHLSLCQHFHGWAMAHGHDLLNLAAAAVGMPGVEPLEQNMVTAPDVEIHGTAPRTAED